MKKITLMFVLVAAIIITQEFASAEPNLIKDFSAHTLPADTAKIRIAESQLADKKDLVCGMPAYKFLKDTAIIDKKIYGFCSKSCKSRFVKQPQTYLKKKK